MLVLCEWLFAQVSSTEGGLGSVKVRVVDPHGGPVSCFALSTLYYLSENEWKYGPSVRNRQVQPRDLQVDAFLLDDVPSGRFVLRIDTLGFARTLSPPFKIEGGGATEVVVRVSRGGVIRGRAVDGNGKPVANASVATADAFDASWWPSDWREFFVHDMPDVTTTSSTCTDRDGHFQLDTLASGTYSLRIQHEALCDRVVRDIKVTTEAPAQLGPVKLERGAIVEGRVVVARNPERFWICVSSLDAKRNCLTFRSETESDATGRFRLPKRVPPGDHTIWFQRDSEKRMNDRAMHRILSLDPHQRPLHVAAGEEFVTAEVHVR